ncbi:MAG: hypothetical protein M3460_07615 [Actinomycetota bacterium]|nr:hypothetical protein [Actinomycetota bacterium]
MSAAHQRSTAEHNTPASWYLRSMRDADTHCGQVQADGTVAAVCGARFAPKPLAYGRRSFPGYPPDPAQACLDCAQATGE